MTATVLSGFEATAAIARLSIKRVLRGKAIWFAVILGLVPALLALAMRANNADRDHVWDGLITTFTLVMTIIAPILVSSSLSDEIDDRTAAYLWSRALPRWTVVTGKLMGLVPIAALSVMLGLTASWLVLGGPAMVPAAEFGRTLVGFGLGALGASAVSALIATLFPRFAVPIAVGWLLLFDATIGSLDLGLHVITVSFGTRAIAHGDAGLAGPLSLAIVTIIATAIAIWRVDRIE